ncbi:MAG: LamG domain-containing protein [Candidatus Falkowbacteria bacterium]
MLRRVKDSRAFTMIELVVVIAVIVIVSVVVYANYNEINDRGEILGVSEKLRQNIRLAQNFSVSGKLINGNLTQGWGVYLNRQSGKYVIFADLNNNGIYDFPTKLLLHGSETVSGALVTSSAVLASSVILGDGSTNSTFPTNTNSAGKPDGSGNGFWTFASANSQYLDAGTSANFFPQASDFTIDLWLNAASVGPNRALLGRDQSYEFYLDTSSILNFVFHKDDGVTTYTLKSSSTIAAINTATWYHTAVVRKGSYLMLFVNGQMHDMKNIGTDTMRDISGNLYIGRTASPAAYFDGSIDEIRMSVGWANWFEAFSVPTVAYTSDSEKFLEFKMPPGVVFEELYKDNSAQPADINLLFSPIDHYLYVNDAIGSSTIVINRGGMERTGLSGDTPRAFKVWQSGMISTTLVP